jgi:ligand-binding SRPBCC domain-containing protein
MTSLAPHPGTNRQSITARIPEPPNVKIEPLADAPGVFRLSTELWLPQPVALVFNFFGDAANLETITPPWLHFRIISGTEQPLSKSSHINYRLRIRGFPVHWRTEITDWNPPHSFQDTQLRGPYRQWIHTHTFTELDGGTLCKDEIDYTMACARFANWLLVRRDLIRIFEYRHNTMIRLFGRPRANGS